MLTMESLFSQTGQGVLVLRFTKNFAEKHFFKCQIGLIGNKTNPTSK